MASDDQKRGIENQSSLFLRHSPLYSRTVLASTYQKYLPNASSFAGKERNYRCRNIAKILRDAQFLITIMSLNVIAVRSTVDLPEIRRPEVWRHAEMQIQIPKWQS